ncbi:outer membrane beta-barrel protein [Beijerinckia mobilis]|uniref:outer membrane beta-barrel protein n=1 Tax=Beijerinckia mobilis TaxID=231434 RepID=UPI00068C5D30|nr:outer membrane beta-barrel protein [Beijerinckia mobilis]
MLFFSEFPRRCLATDARHPARTTSLASRSRPLALCSLLLAAGIETAAAADIAEPPAVKVAPAAWSDTISLGLQIEAGIAGNPANPSNGRNFGMLYSDYANQPMLSQVMVTFQRPLDPSATGYDFGFLFQMIYGTDARYNHILGLNDDMLGGRNQLVPTNLTALAHLPWFTSGGIDVKFGLTPGAMGYEVFDPAVRPFYTFSYMSNFLVPFQHIGGIATWHVNDTFDLYAGIDAGAQTSFAPNDNNSEPAGYFGFGLNKLADGKLNIVALSRLGPEQSVLLVPNANNLMRSWNDVVVTYKQDEKVTLGGEANLMYDYGLAHRTAYGFAGYLAYALNDEATLNVRGELMRDNTGVLVGNFMNTRDYTNSIRGLPYTFVGAPSPTTYGELTVNVTFKPKIDWAHYNLPVKTLMFRPEVRIDQALNGTSPFNNGSSQTALMIGGDIVLGF